MPCVIACTALISEFCKIGRTKNATRIMGILEESGAVIDITIYNVFDWCYHEALWCVVESESTFEGHCFWVAGDP